MSFGFYEVSDVKGFGQHYGKFLIFFVRVITVHLQKFGGRGTRLLLQYKILLYAQSFYIHFLTEIPAYAYLDFSSMPLLIGQILRKVTYTMPQ